MSKLYCIVPYFNFFGEPYTVDNHMATITQLMADNVQYMTVEARLNGHSYLPQLSNTISFNTASILWHKERLINLGIKLIPDDVDIIVWLDSGVSFAEDDWQDKVIKALEIYDVVQLPSKISFLNENHCVYNVQNSFAKNMELGEDGKWQCGYAWAARTDVLKRAGLYDRWIVGSSDALMLRGFYGRERFNFEPDKLNYKYLDDDVQKWIDQLGPVKTGHAGLTALHYWHGEFTNRLYQIRDKMLMNMGYTYEGCIKQDELMLEWHPSAYKLRQSVENYFLERSNVA